MSGSDSETESSSGASFDDDGIVSELDDIADCRENFRTSSQLFLHPKKHAQPIPKSYASLKKNAKLITVFLRRMRSRKGKKVPNINKCNEIHSALKARYMVGSEAAGDTVRRIWDIKRLPTFARASWVLRRRKPIAVVS